MELFFTILNALDKVGVQSKLVCYFLFKNRRRTALKQAAHSPGVHCAARKREAHADFWAERRLQ